jgi:hypothetical protein
MKILREIVITGSVLIVLMNSCNQGQEKQNIQPVRIYNDSAFIQESHIPYKIGHQSGDNSIRSIAVDHESNIWIATTNGVFCKKSSSKEWEPIITGEDRGPAYSVVVNPSGVIMLGTWNGLYLFSKNQLKKADNVIPPISVIEPSGMNAMGPNGLWHLENEKWEKQSCQLPRTLRDAIMDYNGNLWIATDVGLYKCRNGKTVLFQNTSELISSYVKTISIDPSGRFWAGVMGGVSVRDSLHLLKNLTTSNGISSISINCIRKSKDGTMWVGTDVGVIRYAPDGSHSLRFSKRWLTDDKVTCIDFESDGTAWIGTANGVSAIKPKMMTLEDKEKNFYSQLMKRHIRPPWTCGVLRLEIPGDTSSWRYSDDDNDGEYTGGYLAMESFRYAATKDPDAKIKARKAFDFLRYLQTVTGTDGFFARSIVPVNWTKVNDANRKYDSKQIADELVKDPRYKPVEERWRKSKDGKWLWKGDTSSDEMDGHMMGYFFFYEFAADEEEKILIRDHVSKIIDYLIKNNYNFNDIDGTHTHWAVWSPDQLNRDPDWASERSINSLELLAYLKFAGHITGNIKYENEYKRLIKDEGYLENVSRLNSKNPAWQIYFDRTMEGYLFPILLKYETDPKLHEFYGQLIEKWMSDQTSGENLINNLTYAIATGKKVNIPQTIEFLKDAPLDLVDWPIDHTLREDVLIVRSPILEEIQISELPPASIRSTVRWDKNPWAAVQGDASQEREPVFWLWPYWMARYLNIIQSKDSV